MDGKEAYEMLKKATDMLKEHFDSVQILATWDEEGETRVMRPGFGNWYARQGMAQEFVEMDRCQAIASEVAGMVMTEMDAGQCDDPECGDCYPQEP